MLKEVIENIFFDDLIVGFYEDNENTILEHQSTLDDIVDFIFNGLQKYFDDHVNDPLETKWKKLATSKKLDIIRKNIKDIV